MNNNTSCKNCVFANYNDITQHGCSLGMIEKYRDCGSNVLEAYDEEKEFFVIENRLCPFNRNKKWLDVIEKNNFDIEKSLRYETRFTFNIFIFLNITHSIEDLKNTLDSIDINRENYKNVIIVRDVSCIIKPTELRDILSVYNFKWRIQNPVSNTDDEKSVYLLNKSMKAAYYIKIDPGKVFKNDIMKSINDAIIYRVIQFAMIELENGSYVIPVKVHEHWYFNGDINKSVPDNIREYQKQCLEKIIYTQEEIYQH